MDERTQTDDGRSPLRTLVLLALTFAVGYLLGTRSGGVSDQWEEVPSEPTEITIEGESGEGEGESSAGESGASDDTETEE